jgi:hypothetical protein
MKELSLLLFLLSIFIQAQDKVEDINIISGKWKLKESNFTLYEDWEKTNDSTYIGLSYTLDKEEKNISERLYILKLNNHIVYIAQPGNNNPTLFTLISSEDNKFIFENKEHDFPQRITYHFTTDSTLTASIEGDVNGTLKRKEFSFRKTD